MSLTPEQIVSRATGKGRLRSKRIVERLGRDAEALVELAETGQGVRDFIQNALTAKKDASRAAMTKPQEDPDPTSSEPEESPDAVPVLPAEVEEPEE